jgi:hypothetical protein
VLFIELFSYLKKAAQPCDTLSSKNAPISGYLWTTPCTYHRNALSIRQREFQLVFTFLFAATAFSDGSWVVSQPSPRASIR